MADLENGIKRKTGFRTLNRKRTIYERWFWPFIMPAMILFLVVIVVPFVVGLFNSFTGWRGTYYFDPISRTRAASAFGAMVGFANFKSALTDKNFMSALWYTVRYTFVAVISINVVSLCLALLVNRVTGIVSRLLRTIFLMPNMLGALALGFIFQFIFQIIFTDMIFGPEGIVHIEALRYMTQDSVKALFALVMLTTWQSAGYMMLIYIAGLNTIPKDYYEAASLDGASPFYTFWKITVPLLMPSFTIVFFLTLSNSFKLLDQNVALTDGNFDTRMLAYQILRTVRDTNPPDYGKAQAQAVIFFVIVAAISLTQVYFTKKKEIDT
ncbi:MAG: sugar ABC transporter permease [Spirochaetaceae bacterium]|jgi:raffinose/stachyose/melibiose transport system permease protein|nr:sugar ABC transporter permease [Spirochaetaceae bacterium]